MNSVATVFLCLNSGLLLLLPRQWAPLPLLAGACYVTIGSSIEIGPFHFMMIRTMVAVGIIRVTLRGERLVGGVNGLDWAMILWAVWALISSLLHSDVSEALVNRLGLIYDACGIYFLLRIFCQSLDEALSLCRITAVLLIPMSIMILAEKITGKNLFSLFGGISEVSEIRDGRIRAQGPFAHSILAGTVGGACVPLMIGLFQQYRKTAVLGTLACFAIVFASASSGPIMTLFAGIGGVMMWHFRGRMRIFQSLAILSYAALDLIMNAPAYYIIARIDLTGSSTSWHRAALIEAAFAHLSEWWFAGTDYTRHWLSYGVSWSSAHADITNYYLKMGVWGGLPLMVLFISQLAIGFAYVGRTVKQVSVFYPQYGFIIWTIGVSLFAHSTAFISVSYFDQSFVFIYLTLALIASIWSEAINAAGCMQDNE